MKAQEINRSSDPVVRRLQSFRVTQGLTWDEVAEKLGLSRSMVLMVQRGERKLSPKALFKLEQAELAALDRRSAAERLVDSLIGDRDVVATIIGPDRREKGRLDLSVEYKSASSLRHLPAKVTLDRPSEEACRRLRALFVETLDTRLIVLACLPVQLRNEGFFEQLTAESRTRLTTSALGILIPDWREVAVQAS